MTINLQIIWELIKLESRLLKTIIGHSFKQISKPISRFAIIIQYSKQSTINFIKTYSYF